MKRVPWIMAVVAVGAAWCVSRAAADTAAGAPQAAPAQAVIGTAYPGLASGVLTHARLAELPEGVLLKSGEITINEKDLAAVAANAPARVREQLQKNAFFVLENIAAAKLLLALAKHDAAHARRDIAKATDREIVDGYLKDALASVQVSNEEVTAFYEQNKSMFGKAGLEAVKSQLAQYLRQQKQEHAFRALIESLGQKMSIEVSAPWVRTQSVLSRDNPVDKARLSGKPSLVDFGRGGCGPCDMMTPILETLKKKYEGKANVLFVHVGEEEILGRRYGIASIPVQVFFDKDGKEVFRHSGFFPQEEIEKKMAEMGVK